VRVPPAAAPWGVAAGDSAVGGPHAVRAAMARSRARRRLRGRPDRSGVIGTGTRPSSGSRSRRGSASLSWWPAATGGQGWRRPSWAPRDRGRLVLSSTGVCAWAVVALDRGRRAETTAPAGLRSARASARAGAVVAPRQRRSGSTRPRM